MFSELQIIKLVKFSKIAIQFFALFSFVSHELSAQTISISVQVSPPAGNVTYSSNIEDYLGYGGESVLVSIQCLPTATGVQSIYLAGSIRQVGLGSPISVVSPPTPLPPFNTAITLGPGEFRQIRGNELGVYFDEGRLQYNGVTSQERQALIISKKIPEGDYIICLRAYDIDTGEELSAPEPSGCSNVFSIKSFPPPIISSPACQHSPEVANVGTASMQNINFIWNPPAGLPYSAFLNYRLQIVEIPLNMDINQAFRSTTYYIFDESTGSQSSFNYNMSHPPLVPGKRYAFRVQVEDISNSIQFENNGFSEVCTFIFGQPHEYGDDGTASLRPRLEPLTSSHLFYFEEYLESARNILKVQPLISGATPSNITHPTQFSLWMEISAQEGNAAYPYVIRTKTNESIQHIIPLNSSGLSEASYHGDVILRSFGDFTSGKFEFEGNNQLLKYYTAGDGSNKLAIPPGRYAFKIRLMTENGITPISVIHTEYFEVDYPFYFTPQEFPSQFDCAMGNTLTSLSGRLFVLVKPPGGFSSPHIPFDLEVEVLPAAGNAFIITNQNSSCENTHTNYFHDGTPVFKNDIACALGNYDQSNLQINQNGTWSALPETYAQNGKFYLPAGTYRIRLKAKWMGTTIPLTNPLSQQGSFITNCDGNSAFPLKVESLFQSPIFNLNNWVNIQQLNPDVAVSSYLKAKVTRLNSDFSMPYRIRYAIEKLASPGSPGFKLVLKNEYNPSDEFYGNSSTQIIGPPELNSSLGNYRITNWLLQSADADEISISELFPNDEMRLPPGNYKLYAWATSRNGNDDYSSRDSYGEFTLGPALDLEVLNEVSSLETGKLSELFDRANVPNLSISKRLDNSTLQMKIFGSINCIDGALAGKKISLKKEYVNSADYTINLFLSPQSQQANNPITPFFANALVSYLEMDQQPIPDQYTEFSPDLPELKKLRLPPGRYQLCYNVFTPGLSFNLGPEGGYCRDITIHESFEIGAFSEFNCDGTIPPDFSLRPVYPALNDTLPFRMFPFIVQFCPYSDAFRGATGTFTAKKNGEQVVNRNDISNNWPNGPRIGQYHAINGYPPTLVPEIPITNERATFLPVYENPNNDLIFPETVFKRGESYAWESNIQLNYRQNETSTVQTRAQNVSVERFGYGMTRPIPQTPAHNSIVDPGNVKLVFSKGTVPSHILPPLDIVQTYKKGFQSSFYTYEGIVKEAYVVQVCKSESFEGGDIFFTSERVNLNTSFREFITSENPFELMQMLYGTAELEVAIAEPGDYYWRIGWLNDPADANSRFYSTSAVYKFTVGNAPANEVSNATCVRSPENRTPFSGPDTDIIGHDICVGEFRMRVAELSKTGQTYTGDGIITWQNIPFKVVFTDLKINSDLQVFDGTARVEKQIPNGISEQARNYINQANNAISGNIPQWPASEITMGTSIASSVAEQIISVSNLINGQATMPYGVNLQNITDMDGQTRNFIFALIDMEFTAEKAQVSGLLDLDIPDLEWLFELAATGISINPTGFAGDYTLFLPKDKDMRISDDVKFGFKGCTFTAGTTSASPSFRNDGTYFTYRRAGVNEPSYFEAGLGIHLKIAAGNGKALREIENPDGFVTFSSNVILTNREGWGGVFRFDVGERFGFTDIPGLELTCNSLVVDLSVGTNASELDKPRLTQIMGADNYRFGNNPGLFKGLYFKELSGTYRKVMGNTSIALRDLLIDFGDGGFYGRLAAVNLIPQGTAWHFTVDELGIEFQRTITRAYLQGKIPLPIATSDPLSYTCDIKKQDGVHSLNFVVATGNRLNADALVADIALQNSNIKVEIPLEGTAGPKFSADLSGALQLKQLSRGGAVSLIPAIPSYSFEHLKLSSSSFSGSERIFDHLHYSVASHQLGSTPSGTGAPGTGRGGPLPYQQETYDGGGGSGGPVGESAEGSAHGFGASFSNFGLHVETVSGSTAAKLGIKFDLTLHIGPSGQNEGEDTQFALAATGTIQLIGGTLGYGNGQFNFAFSPEVSLGDQFGLSGRIGPVEITEGSGLRIYNGDQKFGDALDINLGIKIKLGDGEIGGSMASVFGNTAYGNGGGTGRYKFFALAVGITLSGSAAIPIAPPFQLTGLGGGFAINMKKPDTPAPSGSYSCSEPAASNLAGFEPKKREHYLFLNARGNVSSDEVFVACMTISAGISGGNLSNISIQGNALFMPRGNRGIAEGNLDIQLNMTESEVAFSLDIDFRTNSPIPEATMQFAMGVKKQYGIENTPTWYLYMGKPANPCSVTYSQSIPLVMEIKSQLKFYFITGNDIARLFDGDKAVPELISSAAVSGKESGGAENVARKNRVDAFFAGFQDRTRAMLNGNTESGNCARAGGLVFGAELEVKMDQSFVFIYFTFDMVFGFDLALINYAQGCFQCGDITNPGMNNWYANGQLYAGMKGDLGLQVDLWFWRGRASLFRAQLAALIQGGGPNPWWGKGGVWARGEVLGGIVSVNTEFKFSFGQQCYRGFDISDIRIINQVTPGKGETNVDIFTVPAVIFNNPVTAVTQAFARSDSATQSRNNQLLSPVRSYDVEYMDADENWIQRKFCFVLNRFDMEQNSNGGRVWNGRPEISSDGLSAKLNMDGFTLSGEFTYKLKVEVEVLEFHNNSDWYGAKNKQGRVERTFQDTGITRGDYSFRTGSSPTFIRTRDVVYATPVPDQRNFHPADASSRWQILFRTAPTYLADRPQWLRNIERGGVGFKPEFKARFISEDGNKEEVICGSCADANRMASELSWGGALPKNLIPGKIYRVEWIRTWKGIDPASEQRLNDLLAIARVGAAVLSNLGSVRRSGQGGDQSSDTASITIRNINTPNASITDHMRESLVFSYHFRVSQYASFKEKLQNTPLTASRSGKDIMYSSAQASGVPERFDVIDGKRYKAFSENAEYFPPLYSLSFFPDDNRAMSIPGKGAASVSVANGGMESLPKLYKDGFFAINAYLNGLGPGHGITFGDYVNYNNQDGPYLPVRAAVASPESQFAGGSNLPQFPSGAIQTTFNQLAGRLTSSEKYSGALSVYQESASGSAATSAKGSSTLNNTGGQSVTNQASHFTLRVAIQSVVDDDVKFYEAILKAAAVEMSRLLKPHPSFGNSNFDFVNPNQDFLIRNSRAHALNTSVVLGGVRYNNLRDQAAGFATRCFLADPSSAGIFSGFYNASQNIMINNIYRKLFNFDDHFNIHPEEIRLSGRLGFAFWSSSNFLRIEYPAGRIYHALEINRKIFSGLAPNPNFINATYINSNLGIETADIFKNLNRLKFRVRFSAPNNRYSPYLEDNPNMNFVRIPSAGTVELPKP